MALVVRLAFVITQPIARSLSVHCYPAQFLLVSDFLRQN